MKPSINGAAGNRQLIEPGDEQWKGRKCLWLSNPENQAETFSEKFDGLKNPELNVVRTWAIKE